MLVVEAHILAAAMQTFGMASLEDTCSEELFSKESTQKGSVQRRTILINALSKLASQCVDLNLVFKVQRSHACMLYICSKRQPGHHYTYRASTHVQQLSDNQQRRFEAETTHEREKRLQQLSAAQVRS